MILIIRTGILLKIYKNKFIARKVLQITNSYCPKCGAGEFITEPNQYDVLFFSAGQFDIRRSESFDDYLKIFCRECASEVDDDAAEKIKFQQE